MRIRFLSAIEPGWSFYRDLLPYLQTRGFEIGLVISDVDLRGGRPPAAEAFEESSVRLETVRVPGGQRLRRTRPWIYLSYVIGAALRTLSGRRADLNVFLTQPPFFALWGLLLRRLRAQKYAVILMDLYPEVLILAGLLKGSGLTARFLSLLSRATLKRADAVLVIGRCMRERLMRMGVFPERIHLTHNWPNAAAIRPVPRNENPLRRELGLGDAMIVLYSGNMGVSHYFEDILEVAQRLQDDPEIRFVFIGRGARRKQVEDAIAGGLRNCLLLDFQPEGRLAQSLGLGDLHFVCLRKDFEGVVVPSKTYGAFAAGRPVVYQGDPAGEIGRLVQEYDLGSVVPLQAPDQLEKVLLEYRSHPDRLQRQGEQARHFTAGLGGRDSALTYYQTIFESLADSTSPGTAGRSPRRGPPDG